MKFTSLMIALGLLAAPIVAQAADVTVQLPDRFQTGRAPAGMEGFATPNASAQAPEQAPETVLRAQAAPAGVERQQAALPRKYTVISPIYLGNDRNTFSYIRFFNGLTVPASTNVLVVGNRTGTVYGTATVTAPVYSSPQYSITEL